MADFKTWEEQLGEDALVRLRTYRWILAERDAYIASLEWAVANYEEQLELYSEYAVWLVAEGQWTPDS